MLVTLSPMLTLVRLVQLEKAQSPMLVTLSGMFTLVRLLQLEKAHPASYSIKNPQPQAVYRPIYGAVQAGRPGRGKFPEFPAAGNSSQRHNKPRAG
ncbi:MAG: hypothetical protein LBH43_14590 [Treponema sp.]|jgi:hypothetical protein|nr:hypothetical protein [Treponema sp.]